MARVRREGLEEYGFLAQRYVESFDRKWIDLGTGDIQLLADLGNSYQVVREVRVVPFALQDASYLALATALPWRLSC